jgi:hypothetical protein
MNGPLFVDLCPSKVFKKKFGVLCRSEEYFYFDGPPRWLLLFSTQSTLANRWTVLKSLNNLWGLGTSRNRVVLTVRQTTFAGGIDSLESIPGLLKSLKIPSLEFSGYSINTNTYFRLRPKIPKAQRSFCLLLVRTLTKNGSPDPNKHGAKMRVQNFIRWWKNRWQFRKERKVWN